MTMPKLMGLLEERTTVRHIKTGLAVASLVAGLCLSLASVLFYSFASLAQEHGALEGSVRTVAVWFWMVLEWPIVAMQKVFDTPGPMYYHSHVQGGYFWSTVLEHLFLNTLGWAVTAYLVFSLANLVVAKQRDFSRPGLE